MVLEDSIVLENDLYLKSEGDSEVLFLLATCLFYKDGIGAALHALEFLAFCVPNEAHLYCPSFA